MTITTTKRTVLFLAMLGLTAAFTGRLVAQHPSDVLFDPSALRTIRLTMAPADWQKLVEELASTTVYPCTFEWNGERLEQVSVRLKGQGTRWLGGKPSLRFRFDQFIDQKLFKLGRLDAQAMKTDASMLRERLIYDVFQRRGVIGPRAMHVRIEVNGSYVGLYTILDQFDQPEVLRMHFASEDGNLYKADNNFGGDVTLWRGWNPDAYIEAFYEWEREKTGEPDDLIQFLDFVNHSSDQALRNDLGRRMDLETLLEYCAINEIVANEDWMFSDIVWATQVQRGMPWGHNFYWYFDPTDGRATPIVWDVNAAMNYYTPEPEGWVQRPITLGIERSVLGARVMQNTQWRDAFARKVGEVLDTAFDAATVVAQLDRIYAQIRDAAEQDPWKPFTNDDFHQDVAGLRRDIPLRVANVRAQLACSGGAFTQHGVGCAGTGGTIPVHDGLDFVAIGRTFTWRLREARGDTDAVLLIGASPTSVNLEAIGMPGCFLFVEPVADLHVRVSPSGVLELPMTIGNDPKLLGVRMFSQFAIVDDGAGSPLAIVASNALETRVGQCR